jgi:hypothetical protein
MPMIDVYAAAGKFSDKHKLAQDLANAVMKWEKVPPINLFKKNTAAFVHELPPDAISMRPATATMCGFRYLLPSVY